MLPTCVILAGGRGTRLSTVVSDVPKPMAPIDGRPFLARMIEYLEARGFARVVLSVGFKHQMIVDYFGTRHGSIRVEYSIEHEPLGTGGAILQALQEVEGYPVFIMNGDSFIDVEHRRMLEQHEKEESLLTIAVKQVVDVGRSGRLELNGTSVRRFNDVSAGPGHINTGVYLASTDLSHRLSDEGKKFSFEATLRHRAAELPISAYKSDGYFIDIGIPADFERAQRELPTRMT